MILLRVCVLTLIISTSYGLSKLEVTLNGAFDYMIGRVLKHVNRSNIDQVRISPLNYTFNHNLILFPLKGELLATNGWLRSLSTLNRTGDVSFRKFNKTLTIEAHLGLGNLEIGYGNYTASIIGINIDGTIKTKVNENSIALKITVPYKDPNCTVKVDVDFEKFDKIDVKATGLKSFNWLLNTIVKGVVYKFKKTIKDNIEKKLLFLFTAPIDSLELCTLSKRNSTKN